MGAAHAEDIEADAGLEREGQRRPAPPPARRRPRFVMDWSLEDIVAATPREDDTPADEDADVL